MADIRILDEKTIRISVTLEDALTMIREAERNMARYAEEIVTIFEKMPVFEYTSFCFYAYDSAGLFEYMLGMDPRKYTSFSLDAPDAFFYALYGGMAALQATAKASLAARVAS
jgi:hypothetical protein